MKLHDYAIKEHLAERDWKAAAEIVASYFGLQMPADYEIVFNRRSLPNKKICIYYGPRSYRWYSNGGFGHGDMPHRVGDTGIYARIYLPESD